MTVQVEKVQVKNKETRQTRNSEPGFRVSKVNLCDCTVIMLRVLYQRNIPTFPVLVTDD